MSRLCAGCKINLGLAVKGRRGDGLHEIESIFLPLESPHDILEIRESRQPGIRCSFTCDGIDPEENTVAKAYALFANACGKMPGLDVHVIKKIPHGAGLGGGSSDAAALLLWLYERSGHALPFAGLERLAARVGADVPFFLRRGPCLVRGIGDVVTPLELERGRGLLVLVCPNLHVSTSWAFARWDELANAACGHRPAQNLTSDFDGDNAFFRFRAAGDGKSARAIIGLAGTDNDLEAAVFPSFPALAEIRKFLEASGAALSAMSGSGSSVYGIFREDESDRAREAAACLSRSHRRVFLAEIC